MNIIDYTYRVEDKDFRDMLGSWTVREAELKNKLSLPNNSTSVKHLIRMVKKDPTLLTDQFEVTFGVLIQLSYLSKIINLYITESKFLL